MSDSPPPAERLTRRLLHEGRIFDLVHDEVRLASGLTQELDLVLHPGAVAIAPRLEDGRFVCVRQYRHALEELVLEFPAGRLELNEDPLEAAKRELAEETGFAAATWTSLGEVWIAPGWATERIHLFLAEDLDKLATPPAADDDEEIYLEEHDADSLFHSTSDAKTLVALARIERRP